MDFYISTKGNFLSEFSVGLDQAKQSLTLHTLPTILSILVILIGIASCVVFLSIGQTIEAATKRMIDEMGPDILIVSPDTQSRKAGSIIPFGVEEAIFLSRHSKTIEIVSPRFTAPFPVKSGENDINIKEVAGIWPTEKVIESLKMEQGRFLSWIDSGKNFIVIGYSLSEELKKIYPGQIIGRKITIKGHPFVIIGILNSKQPGRTGEDHTVFTDIGSISEFFGSQQISYIKIKVRSGFTHQEAISEVNRLLGLRLKRPASIKVQSNLEFIEPVQSQLYLHRKFLLILTICSLCLGGIIVMNVMAVSVNERKGEIGLRRALGAKRRDIYFQILTEAAYICLVGGLIGVFLGISISWFFSRQENLEPVISFSTILLAVGIDLIVAIFAGYGPARKAATMDIIFALRGTSQA